MKIRVEFDLTPAEFREALGWPDVSGLQEKMLEDIKSKMDAGVEGYDPLSLMKPFLSQSVQTLEGFQKMAAGMAESYFGKHSEKK
ncbi:MAG: hypothetical protein KDJ38_05670 [Gammaproteobacteria bacterium]|nr:hypothetical protein [Gammaproteobacteria bacterium]